MIIKVCNEEEILLSRISSKDITREGSTNEVLER